MNIIYSASGVLCLFYIGLLMSKKERETRDFILAGWFVLILLVIITTYLNHNDLKDWELLFEFTDGSVFLHGPMMWFYTQALTDKDFRFQKKDLWHLLPFVVGTLVLMIPVWKGTIISESGRDLIVVVKMVVLLAYEIAVLWRLNRHEEQIGDYYSFTEKVDLNWLKLLVWGFMIIWIIAAISQLLYYAGVEIPQYGGLFTNLALSVFVLIMGYFGIRQTQIFSSPLAQPISEKAVDNESKAQQNQSLAKPSLETDPRFDQLEQFMETQKPYLDSELTLYKLADQLDIPPYQLSQLINQYGGTNFFNFINQYRVREVQSQIQAKAHIKQTLLAIALDCGFNSKASFNRVFKKITGKTPGQYAGEAELW
ncbi:MAG: helix-turn-helix transcriptional regulator [Bacteroidetes bacterium]|nr:helix-turn-helix transcriptional regulator [Bacteroidota bacterium]MCB0843617.1 helix-turn-helix transcriptional regulator [Bacteroidota bacterium]